MGTLLEDQYTFLIISRSDLLRIRNVSEKIVEKIETHILPSITFFFFFRKSCGLSDNAEKCSTAGQVTDDNATHAHCMLDT